jgi:hypothetical protein
MDSSPRLPGELHLEKEPLVTEHSGHEELVEQVRIGLASSRFGHRFPFLPQAIFYLVVLGLLVLFLWWAWLSVS